MNQNPLPSWLADLAAAVTELMYAHDVLSPVGCHYHQEEELWEVVVFASRTEVYGGQRDGKQLPSGFTLDVQGLLELFTTIEAIEWQALDHGADDDVGANLAIVGLYREQHLCLRIPALAPRCFEAGRIAHVLERRFIDLW